MNVSHLKPYEKNVKDIHVHECLDSIQRKKGCTYNDLVLMQNCLVWLPKHNYKQLTHGDVNEQDT